MHRHVNETNISLNNKNFCIEYSARKGLSTELQCSTCTSPNTLVGQLNSTREEFSHSLAAFIVFSRMEIAVVNFSTLLVFLDVAQRDNE